MFQDLDDDFDMSHKLSVFNKEVPSHDSDEFQEFESYQSQHCSPLADKMVAQRPTSISHSVTADSLMEIQTKSFTPSMTSSGYGSQAVSTLTLSSEDSVSIRSINLDEGASEGKDSPPKNTFPTPLSDQGLESIPDESPCQNFSLSAIADQAESEAHLADLINGNVVPDNSTCQENSDLSHTLNQSEDYDNADALESTGDHRSSTSSLMDLNVPLINDTPLQPVSPHLGEQGYTSKTDIDEVSLLADATKKNLNLSQDSVFSPIPPEKRMSQPELGAHEGITQDMDYEMSSPRDQSTPLKKTKSADDCEIGSSPFDWVDSYSENAMAELENMDDSLTDVSTVKTKQPVNRKLNVDGSSPAETNNNNNNTNTAANNSFKGMSRSDSRSFSANSLDRKNSSEKRTLESHLKRNTGGGSARKRRPVSCSIPSGSEMSTSTSMKDLSYQNMNVSTSNETLSGKKNFTKDVCYLGFLYFLKLLRDK